MPHPMRILMVSFYYHPYPGGLPAQTHFLSRALVEQGCQVTVATASLPGAPTREILQGVDIRRLPTLPVGGYRTRAHPWLGPLALFLLANRHAFDVIHVHQALHPAALCVALGRALGKPVIVKVTGSGASGNVQILRTWKGAAPLVRPLLRRAHRIISLSGEITQELLSDGYSRDAILEWPNGVDLDRFLWASQSVEREQGLVVTSTRLAPEKGNDVLLRAWQRVSHRRPHARLLVLGDGDERSTLIRLADQLGIADSVTFAGHVPDVAAYLAKAELFVFSSRYGEGMSNALLEALACGCACLASDIVANREVLAHGRTGALFHVDDHEDFANQMLGLLNDPDRLETLRGAARRAAVEDYSMVAVANRYVDLYRDLTKES